jgi:photosystem II stability/assembly factor-like uncharacterized protein
VAEKQGLDLTVGISGVNKKVVFLFGGMMAYDGEYQSLQSTLLRSEDSGLHWDEVMSPVVSSHVRNFSMLESGVGWALILNPKPPSYKYTLYQTKDNGLNWKEISLIPLSSKVFPRILQMIWIDEFHGQIDMLYYGDFGYIEFLTTNDGGIHWNQSGMYKPEFEGNTRALSVLDSYRSLVKDTSESFNLDHSGFWTLDGRYGDPDTNVIVIQHEIYADDGSANIIEKIVLPRHFAFVDGKIVASQTK